MPSPTVLTTSDSVELGIAGNPLVVSVGGSSGNAPSSGGNITLISNGSASSPVITGLYGGTYVLILTGTMGGTTATLNYLGPDLTNYLTAYTTTVVTPAANPPAFGIGQGSTVQLVLTGGSPSAIYATLYRVP